MLAIHSVSSAAFVLCMHARRGRHAEHVSLPQARVKALQEQAVWSLDCHCLLVTCWWWWSTWHVAAGGLCSPASTAQPCGRPCRYAWVAISDWQMHQSATNRTRLLPEPRHAAGVAGAMRRARSVACMTQLQAKHAGFGDSSGDDAPDADDSDAEDGGCAQLPALVADHAPCASACTQKSVRKKAGQPAGHPVPAHCSTSRVNSDTLVCEGISSP